MDIAILIALIDEYPGILEELIMEGYEKLYPISESHVTETC